MKLMALPPLMLLSMYAGERFEKRASALCPKLDCADRAITMPADEKSASILTWSSPGAGSNVPAPVEAVELRFYPPARLRELTITGPQGTMPMMIDAIGEVRDYSIPVSALAPGSYSVEWTATASGMDYSGAFSFTVVD